jgi:hypothetical protein
MFDDHDQPRPENWRALRMVKLREMAAELRSRAARRPPAVANSLRQMAVDHERSANLLDDFTSRPA